MELVQCELGSGQMGVPREPIPFHGIFSLEGKNPGFVEKVFPSYCLNIAGLAFRHGLFSDISRTPSLWVSDCSFNLQAENPVFIGSFRGVLTSPLTGTPITSWWYFIILLGECNMGSPLVIERNIFPDLTLRSVLLLDICVYHSLSIARRRRRKKEACFIQKGIKIKNKKNKAIPNHQY